MSLNRLINCTVHPYTYFHWLYTYWYAIPTDYDITFVKPRLDYERWNIKDPLNVVINGTTGNTYPIYCNADLSIATGRTSCTVRSNADIGEFKCFTLLRDADQPGFKEGISFDLVCRNFQKKYSLLLYRNPMVILFANIRI